VVEHLHGVPPRRLFFAFRWRGRMIRLVGNGRMTATTKELAIRTYQEIDKHETMDRAAIVAFYAMLSLVPLLGFLLALAFGPARGITAALQSFSSQFLPAAADTIIDDQIQKIQASPPVGVLTVSFMILLWSSSGVFVSLMDGANAAYGVRDVRPWWKRRLLAIVLTTVEMILLLGALTALVVWPYFFSWFGLSGVAAATVGVVRWVVVVIALLASFSLAYYFGLGGKQEWEWVTPGSAFGVVMLIASSLGFRLYLYYGWSWSETYGALAGVVILLLWFYLAALAGWRWGAQLPRRKMPQFHG
jgi:membrane protein